MPGHLPARSTNQGGLRAFPATGTSRNPYAKACDTTYEAGGHEEGWITSGKEVGRKWEGSGCERADGQVPIAKREGRAAGMGGFPRMQRFPAQELRRDQGGEGLASEVTEGRERRKEEPKWEGRD